MQKYILVIDQSTTASKAIIFNRNAEVLGRCDVGHKQISPKLGWLEHDPLEIWQNIIEAIRRVLDETKIDKSDIVALSITNQRETTMLWTSEGKPLRNAIVWQCSRAESIVKRENISSHADYISHATGLQLSPYFSAAKASWILENADASNEILFGTMDSWVIWKLTGNHATDYSNASRTQLFNINNLNWDKKILGLFGLENLILPKVRYSDEIFGYTTVDGIFEKSIPVVGVMGDSHGALFAQQCWKPGMGKCTFGTGGSLMVNIGATPALSHNRLATSIAWGLANEISYVFEGTIVSMGDTIKWLRDEMGLIKNSQESEQYANTIDSCEGLYLIPAFTGLGAPHWKSDVRAIICGMNRFSNKYHVVRAGLEAISYQMRDILDPMSEDANLVLKELRVDGGPTNNSFLMQFTADILNLKIIKNSTEELSALGAAYAGGLAVGFFENLEEISKLQKPSSEFVRTMDDEEAEQLYREWKKYVKMLIS